LFLLKPGHIAAGEGKISNRKFPPGWDEERVQRVVAQCDSLGDEELPAPPPRKQNVWPRCGGSVYEATFARLPGDAVGDVHTPAARLVRLDQSSMGRTSTSQVRTTFFPSRSL
jgi:hypothetical protein